MASNGFGSVFRFTTFGESHGKGIGAVIDGCPSNIDVNEELIARDMAERRPGYRLYTSPRKEPDPVEILSGVFEGKTTGAPIALWIGNRDVDSSKYEPMKEIYRPGHAQFGYHQKYGIYDYLGSGRASARETSARVAVGSFAKMAFPEIAYTSTVVQVGEEKDPSQFEKYLKRIVEEGDSVGGIIECKIDHVPAGIGDPIYEKLEANLAKAMLSINATRGVEFGEGFRSVSMRGSEHNDEMQKTSENAHFATNHHGGIIAGISTGEPIIFRVVFKPASSIKRKQKTLNKDGKEVIFQLPEGSRHDPCVALRAPIIVSGMAAIVIADSMLMNRCSKIDY